MRSPFVFPAMLLALVVALAAPCAASDLAIAKAAVKFDPKKADSFTLSGTVADLSLAGADAVTINLGGTFVQTVPLAQFVTKGDKVTFKAPKGTLGISAITINVAKSTFSVAAKAVTLAGLPFPTTVTVTAGDMAVCRMIAPLPKRKKGAVVSLAFSAKSRPQFPCGPQGKGLRRRARYAHRPQ